MLSGVLTFPFYLNVLGHWIIISLGLMVTGWLTMFWVQYGDVMGGTTARLLGLPALLTATLTLGYAASCCLVVIEETSYGWETFEISPGIDWKEWVWSLLHLGALALQAGIVGAVVQAVSSSDSLLPAACGTLAALPLVLLGAFAADGAWAPLAIVTVLRSVRQVWWAWGLFFLETTPLCAAWTYLTVAGLAGGSPWLMPTYSAPLLAAVILIYARLVGRLAGCIRLAAESLTEGDRDEDS